MVLWYWNCFPTPVSKPRQSLMNLIFKHFNKDLEFEGLLGGCSIFQYPIHPIHPIFQCFPSASAPDGCDPQGCTTMAESERIAAKFLQRSHHP